MIRENEVHVVPLPGVLWAAVRRELGDPWDVRMAIEECVERRHRALMRPIRPKAA